MTEKEAARKFWTVIAFLTAWSVAYSAVITLYTPGWLGFVNLVLFYAMAVVMARELL